MWTNADKNANDGGSPKNWTKELNALYFDQSVIKLEERDHKQHMNHNFGLFASESPGKVQEPDGEFDAEGQQPHARDSKKEKEY